MLLANLNPLLILSIFILLSSMFALPGILIVSSICSAILFESIWSPLSLMSTLMNFVSGMLRTNHHTLFQPILCLLITHSNFKYLAHSTLLWFLSTFFFLILAFSSGCSRIGSHPGVFVDSRLLIVWSNKSRLSYTATENNRNCWYSSNSITKLYSLFILRSC